VGKITRLSPAVADARQDQANPWSAASLARPWWTARHRDI